MRPGHGDDADLLDVAQREQSRAVLGIVVVHSDVGRVVERHHRVVAALERMPGCLLTTVLQEIGERFGPYSDAVQRRRAVWRGIRRLEQVLREVVHADVPTLAVGAAIR